MKRNMDGEEEFDNIIQFDDDPDFDEEELFSLETHPDPHDDTTEVTVPKELDEILNDKEVDDDGTFVLDSIPSITFVSDKETTEITSSTKSKLVCQICNKKYKLQYHYNNHIAKCIPKPLKSKGRN